MGSLVPEVSQYFQRNHCRNQAGKAGDHLSAGGRCRWFLLGIPVCPSGSAVSLRGAPGWRGSPLCRYRQTWGHSRHSPYKSGTRPPCMFLRIRVVIHFVDSIKRRLAHALHPNVCKHDITVLNLVLGMVTVNFHTAAPFDKITFAKDTADDCQPAAWDNAFICEFNGNIFSHGDLRN